MGSSELLEEGFELMLLGMGSVFIFLIVLVFITTIMSRLLTRFFPEPVAAPKVAPKSAAVAVGSVDPELVAAIGAAIKQHRARRG
ncbi:MAG: OadG family transporter subunit [Halopseudomonas yangmingensis]|uniref:Probable oxaloacetate decarboxylase gamma chain n=1 Tax=Halopseudomonas yangmingensis TaxID=1720063 RepID=A0A1I4NKU1_9GAMM|nr:OadG family transporter subunit [Halopseudomonas yangmingensis]SFM16144.1 oxaloacetate decarboxylase, gamma subunit [Halopseudomonas yangmingensis]